MLKAWKAAGDWHFGNIKSVICARLLLLRSERVADRLISPGVLRFLAVFDVGRNPSFPDIANALRSSLRDKERRALVYSNHARPAQTPAGTKTRWRICKQTQVTLARSLTLSRADKEASIYDFPPLDSLRGSWIWVIGITWERSCLSGICHRLTQLSSTSSQGLGGDEGRSSTPRLWRASRE